MIGSTRTDHALVDIVFGYAMHDADVFWRMILRRPEHPFDGPTAGMASGDEDPGHAQSKAGADEGNGKHCENAPADDSGTRFGRLLGGHDPTSS